MVIDGEKKEEERKQEGHTDFWHELRKLKQVRASETKFHSLQPLLLSPRSLIFALSSATDAHFSVCCSSVALGAAGFLEPLQTYKPNLKAKLFQQHYL